MAQGEEPLASAVAVRAFEAAVAPHYAREGVEQFLQYASADALRVRSRRNHWVLLAESDAGIEGMIEVRAGRHIAMLFVVPERQRAGVGRGLVERAEAYCRDCRSRLSAITVNAAPNSVGAYLRFGFVATGPDQQRDGIRYTPMKLDR